MSFHEGPSENDDLGVRIRPYALTGGRTRAGTDLAIEAMVATTAEGTAAQGRLTLERARIVALCVTPQSLAEISAHLGIHLGVARVLVGDVADEAGCRRTAKRAAPGRSAAAGRRSGLLHLNACQRIGRVDAGVLPRPGVAFAFVLGDLSGILLVARVNDEAQLRRHALCGRWVAEQSERGDKNGSRTSSHDGHLIASRSTATACRRVCTP